MLFTDILTINVLFYVSMATIVGSTHMLLHLKVVQGIWMFSLVLVWDLLNAVFIGNRIILHAFFRSLPWLARVSDVFLISLGLSVATFNLVALL